MIVCYIYKLLVMWYIYLGGPSALVRSLSQMNRTKQQLCPFQGHIDEI